MSKSIINGDFKGIIFEYTPNIPEEESNGILIIKHPNGIESTHIIKNWGLTRIMQYVLSMIELE